MAKKRKEPLERWTPPAETFANATKKTGNSGVTYSYEQPKRNSRTVDDVPNIRALGAGDTSASRRTQPASAKTPGQSALSGVETLFAAQRALQENGASGGGGGRVDTTSKKNKRSSFSELMARIGEASRPIGSVISEAKPGESATRAGEVMPSALKSSASGVLDTLSFLLGEAQAAQDRTRTMNRDIAAAHGFAKREDNADEDTKGESWLTRASDALSQEAGRLSEEAAGHEEAAKDGLGKVGQLLVDVGIGGTQLAADAAFGSTTGTGMLPIGVRTFGSGTRKALDAGATRGQAAAYGVGSAALEMLTEKMFDVGKVFGGGAADDLIEKAIEKWAKSPAGARAIRTFFGVLTESGEEAASELVDPIVSLFYDSDAVRETYGTAEGRQQLWQNVKHASTVGGILGGFGTVVNGNRAAEAQQRARQAAEELARRAEAEEQTRRQRAFFAPNDMQTGTADAEAAAALERNRTRANRPQTTRALSRVFNGEQISEAETAAILSDPELMEQMLTATGTPVQDGDVRGAFLRMMEQNGTPLIQTAQNAAESPVTPAETPEGNLPGDAESAAVQGDSGQIREDAYLEKKGRIEGGTDPNSWEYALEHEYGTLIALGEMTEEEARAEWERQRAEKRGVSPEDSTGAAPLGFDPYSNWQNKSDEFHPEGEKAARQVDLPTENPQGQKTMKGGQTVMEAEVTPDERANQIARAYVDGKMAYVSVGNEELAQNATAKIERDGFQKAYVDWTAAARTGKVTDELMAMGATLINNAGNAGMETTQYLDLVSDYVNMSHRAATALQAVRILKTLTPEARLYTMQRSIYSIAEECGIEDAQIPADLAEAYRSAPDEKTRDEIVTQIQKEIAKRVPSTLMDKWNALRYTNMLGNFKTQVRNLAGNTVMGLTASIKRRMQAVFGLAQNLAGGQRDVAAFYRPSLGTAAWNDFDNVRAIAKGEAKFSDVGGALSRNQFLRGINDQRRIFKFLPMEAYRKVTQWAMEKGDDIFIRMTYADAMAQYLAAHGVKTTEQMQNAGQSVLDAARAYAIQEAQEATFHDDNGFSNWVSKMGRRQDTWKPLKVVSEGVMPFRKTPANILVRGVEYSPIGAAASLIKTVQAAAGKGNVSANDAINSWAKTATGSAVLLAGWALARAGLLHGAFDDDDEQAAFEMQTGHQEYALEIGGKSYTIDWCSPTSMSLLVGCELYRLVQDGGMDAKNIEAALSSLADPMINMSMLQGVNDTLDGIKNSDNSLIQMGEKAIVGYFTQGLTNTLLGQIERTFEPNRMTTYVDKESNIPVWFQRELGKASAKTPGWDYHQTEYLDSWGETQSNGDLLARAANNLLNPSYVSEISTDRVDEELARLNEATGDTGIYPASIYDQPKFKYGGNQADVTQRQKEEYQKTYGQTAKRQIEALLDTPMYSEMTNAERNAAISALLSFAENEGKSRIGADRSDISWLEKGTGVPAQDAAVYALLQTAKQTLPKDEQDKVAPKLAAIYGRGASEETTNLMLDQLLDDKQRKKVQTLLDNQYSIEDISAFWGAKNDLKKKADTLAWAEEYGFSSAQANYLWRIFQSGE